MFAHVNSTIHETCPPSGVERITITLHRSPSPSNAQASHCIAAAILDSMEQKSAWQTPVDTSGRPNSSATKTYLLLYNILCGVGWTLAMLQTLASGKGRRIRDAVEAAHTAIVVLQLVATLEFFHACLGLVSLDAEEVNLPHRHCIRQQNALYAKSTITAMLLCCCASFCIQDGRRHGWHRRWDNRRELNTHWSRSPCAGDCGIHGRPGVIHYLLSCPCHICSIGAHPETSCSCASQRPPFLIAVCR